MAVERIAWSGYLDVGEVLPAPTKPAPTPAPTPVEEKPVTAVEEKPGVSLLPLAAIGGIMLLYFLARR